MGTVYRYANLTRKEWFAIDALGGNNKHRGVGRGLTVRALGLLLREDVPKNRDLGPLQAGRWAGDAISILGDDSRDDWHELQQEFLPLDADVIRLVYEWDGFEEIGRAALDDSHLFEQLSHLVVTRQCLELESHMEQAFGTRFRNQYIQQAREKRHWRLYDLHDDLVPG